MQFSEEVEWNVGDFVIAALLLMSAGAVLLLVNNKVAPSGFKNILRFVILVLLVLLWAELAVGIF